MFVQAIVIAVLALSTSLVSSNEIKAPSKALAGYPMIVTLCTFSSLSKQSHQLTFFFTVNSGTFSTFRVVVPHQNVFVTDKKKYRYLHAQKCIDYGLIVPSILQSRKDWHLGVLFETGDTANYKFSFLRDPPVNPMHLQSDRIHIVNSEDFIRLPAQQGEPIQKLNKMPIDFRYSIDGSQTLSNPNNVVLLRKKEAFVIVDVQNEEQAAAQQQRNAESAHRKGRKYGRLPGWKKIFKGIKEFDNILDMPDIHRQQVDFISYNAANGQRSLLVIGDAIQQSSNSQSNQGQDDGNGGGQRQQQRTGSSGNAISRFFRVGRQTSASPAPQTVPQDIEQPGGVQETQQAVQNNAQFSAQQERNSVSTANQPRGAQQTQQRSISLDNADTNSQTQSPNMPASSQQAQQRARQNQGNLVHRMRNSISRYSDQADEFVTTAFGPQRSATQSSHAQQQRQQQDQLSPNPRQNFL